MFQESLVESTSLLRGRSRWPTVFSFALQATIAIALVVLPLVHREILPLRAPKISLNAPRLKPPVVPEQRVRVETANVAVNTVSVPVQDARSLTITIQDPGPETDQPSLPVGVNLAGPSADPISVLGSGGPAGPHVVVGPAAGPMHVSTGVMAGQLLQPIAPEYPTIARLNRTEGTVVVQAVISKSGKIESARVVSGPAVLQAAALEAVRAARYRPYLLNGLPTEVETTVSIMRVLKSAFVADPPAEAAPIQSPALLKLVVGLLAAGVVALGCVSAGQLKLRATARTEYRGLSTALRSGRDDGSCGCFGRDDAVASVEMTAVGVASVGMTAIVAG